MMQGSSLARHENSIDHESHIALMKMFSKPNTNFFQIHWDNTHTSR